MRGKKTKSRYRWEDLTGTCNYFHEIKLLERIKAGGTTAA